MNQRRRACGALARQVFSILICLAVPGPSLSMEAGALALRPGEVLNGPTQRGLDEIERVPEIPAACPSCSHPVRIPDADSLMRKPLGADKAPPWRMEASTRDSDLCPYPAPNRLAYQADIVLCPSCGYANRADAFAEPLDDEAKRWILATLRPAVRETEAALMGTRAETMTEEEIVEFFDRQDLLPDTLRTEHYRVYLLALHAPALERADACLTAAWASRREVAAPPRGAVLAKAAETMRTTIVARTRRGRQGLHEDAITLRALLRRMEQNREEIPGGEHMAGRMLLAGMYDRLGFIPEAEGVLRELYHELRERYLRHEQDPLWSQTSSNASIAHRLTELETMRTEGERETLARMEMLRRENEQLLAAAQCTRDAFRNGELDGRHDEALFRAYMMGECLRRGGILPLASEWFNILLSLAEPDSNLARAAKLQLEYVGEEAGDKVNLLSALGQDSELFAILRRICRQAHPEEPARTEADTPAVTPLN